MDLFPFRNPRLNDRPNSVGQRASSISQAHTSRSPDRVTPLLLANQLPMEQPGHMQEGTRFRYNARTLSYADADPQSEIHELKAQLAQVREELAFFKAQVGRLDTSPRREGNYEDQLKKIKSERNASNERYQRQVARNSQLLRENEELKSKLAHTQALHFEQAQFREPKQRLSHNFDIVSRSSDFSPLSGRYELERIKEALEAKIENEGQRLQRSLKKWEAHFRECEDNITLTIKNSEASMGKVAAIIKAKNLEVQGLKEELSRMRGQHEQATQELLYREQELVMTNEDHDNEVSKLKSELSRANAKLYGRSSDEQLKEQLASLQKNLQTAEKTILSLVDHRKELNTAMSSLETECAKAKTIATQKADNERTLSHKCESLERSLNKLRRDYTALAKHNLELQRTFYMTADAEEAVKPKLTEQASFLDEIGRNITEPTEILQRKPHRRHNSHDELGDLRRQVEAFKVKIAELRRQNQDMQASLLYREDLGALLIQERNIVEQLKLRLSEMEYELEKAAAKEKHQASQVESLTRQVKEQSGSVSSRKSEKDKWKTKAAQLKESVTQLEINCEQLQQDNEDLHGTIKELTANNQDLGSRLDSAQRKLADIDEMLDILRREAESEAAGRRSLAEDKSSLERLLHYYKESLDEFRAQGSDAKTACLQAQAELSNAKREIDEYKDLMKAADLKVTSLLDQLEATQKQSAEVNDVKEAAVKESRGLRNQIKTEKDAVKAANQQIEAISEELDRVKKQSDKIKEVREKVLADLKLSKDRIKALKDQLKASNQQTDTVTSELAVVKARELELLKQGRENIKKHQDLVEEIEQLRNLAVMNTTSVNEASSIETLKLIYAELTEKLKLSQQTYEELSDRFEALQRTLLVSKTATLEDLALIERLKASEAELTNQVTEAHMQVARLSSELDERTSAQVKSDFEMIIAQLKEDQKEATLRNVSLTSAYEAQIKERTETYEAKLKVEEARSTALESHLAAMNEQVTELTQQLRIKETLPHSASSLPELAESMSLHEEFVYDEQHSANLATNQHSNEGQSELALSVDQRQDDEVSRLQEECSQLQQHIDNLANQIDFLRGQVERLTTEVGEKDKDNFELQRHNTELSEGLQRLKADMLSEIQRTQGLHEAEMKRLKDEMELKLKENEVKAQQLAEEYTATLLAKTKAYEENKLHLEDQLALQAQVRLTFEDQAQAYLKEIADYKLKAAGQEAAIADYMQRLERETEAGRQLQAQKNELVGQSKAVDAELNYCKDTIAKLQSDNKLIENDMEVLRQTGVSSQRHLNAELHKLKLDHDKLTDELRTARTDNAKLSNSLKQTQVIVDELDQQNQNLNIQLTHITQMTQMTTSLNTEELDDIREEVEELEANAKNDEIGKRLQSDELEAKDKQIQELELALLQADRDKSSIEIELRTFKELVSQRHELLEIHWEDSYKPDNESLEVATILRDDDQLQDKRPSPTAFNTYTQAELEDRIVSLEEEVKTLKLDSENSDRHLKANSDMPNQGIMYNAIKKALELKGHENQKLEHLLEKVTAELNDALNKASHLKSRNRGLKEDLKRIMIKYNITEEERIKSVSASDGLEQKLSDAEFQIIMYKNALKQKDSEIDSLNKHCADIEQQIERYQRAIRSQNEDRADQAEMTLARTLLVDFDSQVEKVSVELIGGAELIFETLRERISKLGAMTEKCRRAYQLKVEKLNFKVSQLVKENAACVEAIAQLQSFQRDLRSTESLDESQGTLEEMQDDLSLDQVNVYTRTGLQSEHSDFLEVNQQALLDKANPDDIQTAAIPHHDELKTLQIDYATLSAKYDSSNEQLQTLTNQLTQAEQVIKNLTLDCRDYRAIAHQHSEAENELSIQLDLACKTARQLEHDKQRLESQLHSAIATFTDSRRANFSQLVAKSQDLETKLIQLAEIQSKRRYAQICVILLRPEAYNLKITAPELKALSIAASLYYKPTLGLAESSHITPQRHLYSLQDHCEELELKETLMTEKVKVLMAELEDSQRQADSLAQEHKRDLAKLSESLGLKSKHIAQMTAELDLFKRQKDEQLGMHANESLTHQSDFVALMQELEAAKLKIKLLEEQFTEDEPEFNLFSFKNLKPKERTKAVVEVSSDVAQSIHFDSLNASGEDFDFAEDLQLEGQHEIILGEGHHNGKAWRLDVVETEVRLCIDDACVFSSEDWLLNPESLRLSLERIARALDVSIDQAELKLYDILQEVKQAKQTEQGGNARRSRNLAVLSVSDEDTAEVYRAITEPSELVSGDLSIAYPEVSFEISSLSVQPVNRKESLLKGKMAEISELQRTNQALQDKLSKFQEIVADEVETAQYKMLHTKQVFMQKAADLPLKDAKTEEFLNCLYDLLELQPSERALLTKKRTPVKKGFFSMLR